MGPPGRRRAGRPDAGRGRGQRRGGNAARLRDFAVYGAAAAPERDRMRGFLVRGRRDLGKTAAG